VILLGIVTDKFVVKISNPSCSSQSSECGSELENAPNPNFKRENGLDGGERVQTDKNRETDTLITQP